MTLSRFEAIGLLPDNYVNVSLMRFNERGVFTEWDSFGLSPEHAVCLFEQPVYFVHRGQIRIDNAEGRMFVRIDEEKWKRRYAKEATAL